MGFIKCVCGKADHFIVDLIGNFLRNAIGDTSLYALFLIAVHKVLAFRLHDRCFLFGHGSTHQITSSITVAGETTDNLHNLLLINDATVGGCQDRLKLRTVIMNALPVASSLQILRNKVHRARTVQGDTGDNFRHAFRLQLLHELLHPGALKLEDSLGASARDQLPYILILQIQMQHILIAHATHSGGILHNRQRTKTKEIHFQKTKLLQRCHRVLRCDIAL